MQTVHGDVKHTKQLHSSFYPYSSTHHYSKFGTLHTKSHQHIKVAPYLNYAIFSMAIAWALLGAVWLFRRNPYIFIIVSLLLFCCSKALRLTVLLSTSVFHVWIVALPLHGRVRCCAGSDAGRKD